MEQPDTDARPPLAAESATERLGLSPADEHNRRLAADVHPSDWRNPVPEGRYNLVVIGAGTAGLVAAAGAAGMGARVALVERHLMGGDCLNVGCVPSKSILRSAHAAHAVREAPRFGVAAGRDTRVDFGRVMERVRSVRADIGPHDSARRFSEHYGVDVHLGEARFTGHDSVEVDGVELVFSRAVIATGARPVVPPIPGLAEAGFLTNETLFNLTEQPRRLAVIGGGPIGCEMAQAFARLGTEVTVIEAGEQLLAREDPQAVEVLRASLVRDGVELRLATRVEGVLSSGDTRVLTTVGPDGPDSLPVDAILLAAGRAPNVSNLGLEAAGVAFDDGGVRVDDTLRTTNPRIYASGDVCLPFRFTHTADAASRAVVQNALFPGPRKRISSLVVPWCTYTDPELAHVGISPREVASRGRSVETVTVPMAEVDRAVAEGEDEGFLKVHLAAGSDRILGATVVGRHAGEMVSEITAAIVRGTGLRSFAGVIHPYPTRAEAIRRAADAANRGRLTPLVARLLRLYFSWRR